MYSLVPEVARIAPTGGSLSRNTRRRNAHLAHVEGQTAARLRRFRGWTGKTFLSRIPFKSAVNAGRASKGPGVRVAYKEKNRLGGEGEEERNISISQLWRTRALVAMQCTASNIRMAVRLAVRPPSNRFVSRTFCPSICKQDDGSLTLLARRIKPEM